MLRSFWRNGSLIFSHKQVNILSAATVIMVAVAISRLLGLLRDRLLAGTFFGGQERQLDVYFAAFRLPDMIFQLLVLGALSAAFIPVFSRYLEKDEKEAYRLSSSVINFLMVVFILLALIVFVFARPLASLIAPAFSPAEINLMVDLTRIMLLAQIFFCVSNFLTGVIQSKQRFLVPALSPIVYNLGIIFGIVGLGHWFGIFGPTIGVVLGAFLHLIIQLPLALRLGLRYSFVFDWRHPGVREVVRLMLPRTFALAVNQIELTVAVFLATSLAAGSLSIFYFAQHLMNLPIGLFGTTIGQAALPTLSRESGEENFSKFKETFLASFNQILYLVLPASAILLVLRIPAVRIVFGAASFPWKATLLTGRVLAIFSISIFAQAVVQLLVRGFYALHDTKTPFWISVISVFANVVLSFLFIFRFDFGILGLAWATTIASFLQTGLLLILLNQAIGGFGKKELFIPVIKMSLATFLTAVALWIPMRFLDQFILDTTRTINLVILTIIATFSGVIVYFVLSYLFNITELKSFISLAKKLGRWQQVLKESEEIITTSSSQPTSEEVSS
ncbi:murein biosynthesis integral membrane protein MurJ [Microgenomates group bacterium RBG_19FT_COMBO_39_10]|nr:MAG: murein biosynthesis integral membrane protein MurJ [Microgenomates group bacterium RBG_19FT_COMBO_39_10]